MLRVSKTLAKKTTILPPAAARNRSLSPFKILSLYMIVFNNVIKPSSVLFYHSKFIEKKQYVHIISN